jgi:hypothetical protein
MLEFLTVIGSESAGPTVGGQAGVDRRAPAAGAGKQSLLLRLLAAAGSLAPLVGVNGDWGNAGDNRKQWMRTSSR